MTVIMSWYTTLKCHWFNSQSVTLTLLKILFISESEHWLCVWAAGRAPGSDPINSQHSLGPLAPEFLMAGPGVCCCLCLAGVKCFISQSNWNIIWTEQDNWYFKWFHSTNHKKDIAVANRYIIYKKNAQSKKIEDKNLNIYTPKNLRDSQIECQKRELNFYVAITWFAHFVRT